MKKDKQIILIGFMGTGKTVVSRLLAERLGIQLVDTDEEIIKNEKMDINSIFRKYGEDYFRKCESNVLKNLLNSTTPSVISTGGGIVLSAENREAMVNSIVILLEASPLEIVKRIGEDKERPLLKNSNNMLENITNLLDQRIDLYENNCDIKINTDNKTIEQITNEIITKLISFNE